MENLLVFTKIQLEITNTILKSYRMEFDEIIQFYMKKLENVSSTNKNLLDNFCNVLMNIKYETNENLQLLKIKSFKQELRSFKNNSFILFEDLIRDLKEKQIMFDEIDKELGLIETVGNKLQMYKKNNPEGENNSSQTCDEDEEYFNINIIPMQVANNSLDISVYNKEILFMNEQSQKKSENFIKENCCNINSINSNHVKNIISSSESNKNISIEVIEMTSNKFQSRKRRKTNLNNIIKVKVDSNRPDHETWNDDKLHAKCGFCGISSGNKKEGKKLGPLYGPFLCNKMEKYVHELCALYSPTVYINKHNKMENVEEEIKKAKYIICEVCKQPGASIFCYNNNCKLHYHYLCGKQSGCMFENQKFFYELP